MQQHLLIQKIESMLSVPDTGTFISFVRNLPQTNPKLFTFSMVIAARYLFKGKQTNLLTNLASQFKWHPINSIFRFYILMLKPQSGGVETLPDVLRNEAEFLYQYAKSVLANETIAAKYWLDILTKDKATEGKARVVLAQVFANEEKYFQAAEYLLPVCSSDSTNYPALHNIALYYLNQGKYSEAQTFIEKAIRLKRTEVAGYLTYSEILLINQQPEQAIDALKALLKVKPDNGAALKRITDLLWETNDEDPFRYFRQAKLSEDILYPYVSALVAAGEFNKATKVLRSGLAFNQRHTLGYQLSQCELFNAEKKFKEGLAYLENQAQLTKDTQEWLSIFLVKTGQFDEAEAHLNALIKLQPDNQGYWCWLTTIRKIKSPDIYFSQYSNDTLIKSYDLTEKRLDTALKDYLIKLHKSQKHPFKQSVKFGSQTPGRLFNRDSEVLYRFKQHLSVAIDQYVSELEPDLTHPTAKYAGSRWQFSDSWSILLKEGGFHASHFHSSGWLSAVYYVSIPTLKAAEGCIQFGLADGLEGACDEVDFSIVPETGKLVIFPSYLWHSVTPFNADDYRLTVAFDILPVEDKQ